MTSPQQPALTEGELEKLRSGRILPNRGEILSLIASARRERILEAALIRYGAHHDEGCDRKDEEDPTPCSCGFDAALSMEPGK